MVDPTLERTVVDGFAFPLGAYPVEACNPQEGYSLLFEPAEVGAGEGDGGDWDEWPDRYLFDIVLSAPRVEPLLRALFAMLPGRVYPILDVLGYDAYREVDPYVAFELIGQDRFMDGVRRYRGYLYEDGLVGFGAMSEEPFLYVFLDEHKIITVRAEVALRERIERLLAAFDLTEAEQVAGADSVVHEHRTVLLTSPDRQDLLSADEIVEELVEDWGLVLNIDPESNVDAEGEDLGIVGWRCVVRSERITETPGATSAEGAEPEHRPSDGAEPASATAAPPGTGETPRPIAQRLARYAEVLLTASCLREAEELALEAVAPLLEPVEGEGSDEHEEAVVTADRMLPEDFGEGVGEASGLEADLSIARAWHAAWME